MTSDEALNVLADHATCNALQEIVENGEWDSYIDADLSGAQSAALRDRLAARVAAGPDAETLAQALSTRP